MRLRSERGVAAVEVVGFMAVLLSAGLFAFQLQLYASTAVGAEVAARTAWRALCRGADARAAAEESLSPNLRDGARITIENDSVTVTVSVPGAFPGLSADDLELSRSAEFADCEA